MAHFPDFTPLVRPGFIRRARRTDIWSDTTARDAICRRQLLNLLQRGACTEIGRRHDFPAIAGASDTYEAFRRIPVVDYERIRPDVMRMIRGEKNVLAPGRCRYYAQSSGTSGGKSKYIPVTDDSLRLNHYFAASDVMAHYLRANPRSRIFSGKGFILGGSFANELHLEDRRVRVGDLSATLISRIPILAGLMRVPSRHTALMADWQQKLPRLAEEAMKCDITNLSGVPSWFLIVLKEILRRAGASTLHEIWPGLEVFFHGGISFRPYRSEFLKIVDAPRMHFIDTYNASEGFFAMQDNPDDPAMLLSIDAGIFYEFIPLGSADPERDITDIRGVREGEVYELVISAPNGLWRYRLGDTVRITSTAPLRLTIAGRTRSFINAFGEELMEENAERAIADVCAETGCSISNYTAGPVFTSDRQRGHHEWLVEWIIPPSDIHAFASLLDRRLRELNSDYDAKRGGDIFLAPPEVVSVRKGLFSEWLRTSGTGKLGGQRKVPRLANDRSILDPLLRLNSDS